MALVENTNLGIFASFFPSFSFDIPAAVDFRLLGMRRRDYGSTPYHVVTLDGTELEDITYTAVMYAFGSVF